VNNAHLTPAKLLVDMPMPPRWSQAKTAFICYTPYPIGFDAYVEEVSRERYFLHSPADEVRLCRYKDMSFIVISEVYGFPVGATTIEELIYRGVDTIIGIGYAGAFDAAPIGQRFIATETISDLPQARHYGFEAFQPVKPTQSLLKKLLGCIGEENENWKQYRVWNSNALYRESPDLIKQLKGHSCAAVNMDVLSLYAVASVCAQEVDRDIHFLYVGTVTDAESDREEQWSSDLSQVISGTGKNPHDDLVRFMVEEFLGFL